MMTHRPRLRRATGSSRLGGAAPAAGERSEVRGHRQQIGKSAALTVGDKHPKVRRWLARHPRWTFHFTPTSASWLNAVEGFFAKLTKRRLKCGVFLSVVDLQAAINRFVVEHNAEPKPFTWTADPNKIIQAVRRGHQVLDSIHVCYLCGCTDAMCGVARPDGGRVSAAIPGWKRPQPGSPWILPSAITIRPRTTV